MKKTHKVYLDYAATTPVDPRVAKAMQPYLSDEFGNAGSLHGPGRRAKQAVEHSRKQLADILRARAGEIIFTSSASEANNLALKGVAWASLAGTGNAKKRHMVVSAIEHDSVLAVARWLETQGIEVTLVPVDKAGLVHPQEVKKHVRKDTMLVSVMHANNEIGTINPIGEIGKICREKNILFHTDAAQTFGALPLDVNRLHIDLLTASAHKLYGPKGAGLLYVRSGIPVTPLLHGGGQEFGLRSSTPNVAGIVGFARAAGIAQDTAPAQRTRLSALRDALIAGVLQTIADVELGGHAKHRLPNNAHFIFSDIEGEAIVLELDKHGIAASNGSACSSFQDTDSHVLAACGYREASARGSLRLSLGRETTKKELVYVLEVLPNVIEKLRKNNRN